MDMYFSLFVEDVTNIAAACATSLDIVDWFRFVYGPAYEKNQN